MLLAPHGRRSRSQEPPPCAWRREETKVVLFLSLFGTGSLSRFQAFTMERPRCHVAQDRQGKVHAQGGGMASTPPSQPLGRPLTFKKKDDDTPPVVAAAEEDTAEATAEAPTAAQVVNAWQTSMTREWQTINPKLQAAAYAADLKNPMIGCVDEF